MDKPSVSSLLATIKLEREAFAKREHELTVELNRVRELLALEREMLALEREAMARVRKSLALERQARNKDTTASGVPTTPSSAADQETTTPTKPPCNVQ